MKFFKNKKGFTLVELVVVIAILGILAGIAIPRFMDATASARGAKIVADMRTLESAETMYYAKNGSFTNTMSNLIDGGYVAVEPKAPKGSYIIPESNKTGTLDAETAYTLAITAATATANEQIDVKLGDLTLKALITK